MVDDIRILHTDDNPEFVDLTAEFLERDNPHFTVETAHSGADGLAQLTPAVDCIISDYDMPGMNGLEFLEAVREDYPDLPFILFTGKGSEEVAGEALTLGATDYLQKDSGTDQYELLANRVSRSVRQFHAERELERKNEMLEKSQDIADVGAWVYNPQTEEAYFTDKVYEIYGVDTDHDPEPEADIQRFYHPDDRDTMREAAAGALEDEEPYDIEVRITADDGTEKWVRTRADPKFEDGACQRVRGTIRDITERKERERDLAQTKEWYQTLLDAAPDAVFVAEVESGEICETNQAATRLLDRPEAEIVGLDQTALHPPEEAAAYRELFDHHVGASDGTLGEPVEVDVVDADGQVIPVEINVQTVEIDGTRYRQGYFRDIRDRKRRERELQRQNERLSEFATVVSHDLRNLLRTLSASLELLETPDRDDLERCHRTVGRMERLIDDLVSLAQHGETPSEPEPVHLPTLTRECAQTAGVVKGTVSVATDATVIADEARLRQLFENLFSNAYSHGGDGVTLTVGRLEDGFYVEDDGRGIPDGERERVFRVGYSTSDEGTGFGLNIVKQVAEARGWDIRVTESAEGGARFEFTGVEFAET